MAAYSMESEKANEISILKIYKIYYSIIVKHKGQQVWDNHFVDYRLAGPPQEALTAFQGECNYHIESYLSKYLPQIPLQELECTIKIKEVIVTPEVPPYELRRII